MSIILAIDPGSEKCGVAVVSDQGILFKDVIPRDGISNTVSHLISEHSVEHIIVGDGTGGKSIADELRAIAPSIELVDEYLSSRRAKARFLKDNPPKGLYRLIPHGLLTPNRPYDDYVAVILAEDYLKHS